jgi:hypothetical protein
LPSKEELNLIYINLRVKLLGDFSMGWYWSSSEGSSDRAWYQRFSDGYQNYTGDSIYKGNKHSVRAVRQF